METRNNLPVLSTTIVGREAELAEITALLADPACRLLTLTGPGGIGKTRLALEAAYRAAAAVSVPNDLFPDGVFFVSLQPVSAVEFLVTAIAEPLGLTFFGTEDPRRRLIDFLQARRLLILLDNFEHLLEGADMLAELLAAAPGVKLLVTSREVLNLQEEWVRPVHGLSCPESEAAPEVEAYGAVQLFAERARRLQPDFSLAAERRCVARLCRLVAGVPLALELAAAWTKSLPCAEIVAEIQRSLDFLATGFRNLPERHRSMRAVFEHSWNQLSVRERQVFPRLAVFQGGFSRQAALAVAGADLHTLQSLVDKSLLRPSSTAGQTGRFEIHELLRQFAFEKLSADPAERQAVASLHCAYYTAFLDEQAARLRGPDQVEALKMIDSELDNLRVAWRWAVEEGQVQRVAEALAGLQLYYQMRSRHTEAAEAFSRAVTRFAEAESPLLGELSLIEAWFRASTGGPKERVIDRYNHGFALLTAHPEHHAQPFSLLGLAFREEGGYAAQAETLERMLQERLSAYRQAGDPYGLAWTLYSLGILADRRAGRLTGVPWMRQSLEAFHQCGDRWGATFPLHHLGSDLIEEKRFLEARPFFEEALPICQAIGDQGGVAFALHCLGEIATGLEEYAGSHRYLADAARISLELKSDMVIWHLFELAVSLASAGQAARGIELLAMLSKQVDPEELTKYVQPTIDRISAQMDPEIFNAAWKRGLALELETVVAALVREFSPDGSEAPRVVELPLAAGTSGRQPLAEPLSPRELEVLALLSEGLSNREIAGRLHVTPGTVKKHLNNIFGKLQAESRLQAVARARALDLLV